MVYLRLLVQILIFLLFVKAASAEIENYNEFLDLTLQYNLNTNLDLEGSSMNYLIAELLLVPKSNDRQEVPNLETNSNPLAEIMKSQEKITYKWTDYAPSLSLGYNSKIKTKNIFYKIDKVSFPLLDVPEDYQQYLREGETIDITPEIVDQAAEIIEGETDLYVVVFKLAEWTKSNIKYDLNTLTAEAAQKSSWVLENREGVCDEMTSLFISFLRSVGIPARFVSGSVYTNLGYKFENHGWAEVYFPGQGWVPYDVTFGQYGWIDPSHIELSKTLDSKVSSVKYTWESVNLKVNAGEMNRDIEILSQGQKILPVFNIDVEILKNQVGPGSYVPVKVTVENTLDGYLSDSLYVTKAPTNIKDNQKQVLLKPNGKSMIFWIIKVPDDLLPERVYSSKIEIKDMLGSSDEEEVSFAYTYESFSEEEANNLIEELQTKEEKSYSEELSLDCNAKKPYYYPFEQIELECNIQNIGNTLLENVNVCLDNKCQLANLRIAERQKIIFEPTLDQAKEEIEISAKYKDSSLFSYVNIKLLNKPDLVITGLSYPRQIDYNQNFNISFILTSEAEVKDLVIEINNLKKINVEKKERTQEIVLEANSKHFVSNKINMDVKFKDEYGTPFEIRQQAEILVINTPWYARVLEFFRNLF